MPTKQYIEYIFPGLIVSDTCRREIPDWNLPAVDEIPEGAVGYRYLQRTETVVDGEKLIGPDRDISPWVFWGESYDIERVAREVPNNEILLSNMRNNDYPIVCRTWRGNFLPIGPKDKIHPPPEGYVERCSS